MRVRWGSPRRLLALLGVILILLVLGTDRTSALNGLLIVIGMLLLLVSLAWTIRIRRRAR